MSRRAPLWCMVILGMFPATPSFSVSQDDACVAVDDKGTTICAFVEEDARLPLQVGTDQAGILMDLHGDDYRYAVVNRTAFPPTKTFLQQRSLKNQDYTQQGVFIKLRAKNEKGGHDLFKDALQYIQGIYTYKNPGDTQAAPTSDNANGWSKVNLDNTIAGTLTYSAYFQIQGDGLTDGDFLTTAVLLKNGSIIYVSVFQFRPWKSVMFWDQQSVWDVLNFPLFTFTDITAFSRGDPTTLFQLITFFNMTINVWRYESPDKHNDVYILTPFVAVDPIAFLNLRGQVVGGANGNETVLQNFLTSFHFGAVLGLRIPQITLYLGYGFQPVYETNGNLVLDNGLIVGASIFDFLDALFKPPPK